MLNTQLSSFQKFINLISKPWRILNVRSRLRVYLTFLIAIATAVFDPLGIGETVNERSTEFLLKTLSPFYPAAGQEKIAVVLIDENSIANFDFSGKDKDRILTDEENASISYPVRLENYADILDAIIAYKPKAIFIDLLIQESGERFEREGVFLQDTLDRNIESLSRTIASKDAENTSPFVPIYFANPTIVASRPGTKQSCSGSVIQETGFFREYTVNSLGVDIRPFVSSRGYENYYPLISKNICGPSFRKNLTTGADERANVYAPAYRLYKDVCQTNTDFCPKYDQAKDIQSPPTVNDANFKKAMVTRWGDTTTRFNTKLYKSPTEKLCQDNNPGNAKNFFRTMQYFLNAMINGENILGEREITQLCYYHDTISAKDLLIRHRSAAEKASYNFKNYCTEASSQKPTEISKNNIGDEALAARICDRVIFLGMDLVAINDYTTSPTMGQIPGVFSHSMAFDNLLSYGGDYLTEPNRYWLNLDTGALFELGFLLLFLAAEALAAKYILKVQVLRRFIKPKIKPENSWLKIHRYLSLLLLGVIAFVLVYGIVFIAEVIYVEYFNLEPNDWLGIATVAFGFLIYIMNFFANGGETMPIPEQQQNETGIKK
jgi:CHASE2 domain-containing sensor protein